MLRTHAEYLRQAYKIARHSGDLSTQNGALLVHPESGAVLSNGWNDLHPNFEKLTPRRERPAKYEWTEHAERSAIYHAAFNGTKTSGLWLYCPWLACADCGRAIVYAGITKCIRHNIPQHALRPDWAASIATADQMFREAGIEVVEFTGTLGVKFRFNGEEITV